MQKKMKLNFQGQHAKKVLAAVMVCAAAGGLDAQTVVKGRVTDQNGEPLIGATVAVNNSTENGMITDINGEYTLKVNRNLTNKDIITFRYLGFRNKDVKYNGKDVINVKMEDDAVAIDRVVVTALGIRREEKGLGYATQTVGGEDITATMPNNWSLALQGEVAGLNVNTAGGPMSSTQINLRGNVSMNMDGNGALIVVDGVPLSSPMNNPGGSYGAGGNSEGSVDYGNGFSDLNPEDKRV